MEAYSFKIGQKVQIKLDSQYYDQGVAEGVRMVGEVYTEPDTGGWQRVKWANGYENTYQFKDLEPYGELKISIMEMNGFKIGDLVEVCQSGRGFNSNYLGKQFTIVEFGSYGGDQGVKLRQDDGKIYENISYDNFVCINSIRKVSTKEVVTKLYVDAIEPEETVSFTVAGETVRYHLESQFYKYPIGNNAKIFELLGMDEYAKRKFCSEAYGYEEGGGDWPTWKSGDKEAPIKIIRAIRQEISRRSGKSDIVEFDRLLEEAKRRYPINTKYTPLHSDGQHRSDVQISDRECRWVYDDVKPVGIDCGIGYVYILENDTWAEVINESFGYERDSILEEARRRYPIGVKYKPLNSNGKIQEGAPSKAIRECRWVSEDGIDCGWGYVYANGKWAELVGEKDTEYDSILAEAKRRYPIGSKYMALNSTGGYWGETEAKFECKWYRRKSEGGDYDGIESGDGLVYWNGKWADVVSEYSVSSGDGLLAEARRRYPIGTKYICASESRYEYTVTSQYFSMPDPLTVFGEEDKGCLYYNGKWAEITYKSGVESGITTRVGFDDFKPKLSMADRYSTSGIDISSYAQGVITGSELIGSSGKSLPEHQTAIILPKKEKKSKIRVI